jgi:hypothetical protein
MDGTGAGGGTPGAGSGGFDPCECIVSVFFK